MSSDVRTVRDFLNSCSNPLRRTGLPDKRFGNENGMTLNLGIKNVLHGTEQVFVGHKTNMQFRHYVSEKLSHKPESQHIY